MPHVAHAADSHARAITACPLDVGCTPSVVHELHSLSPAVLARHGHHPLVFSTPWVALGLGRYLKLALRDGAGSDPSALAVSDAVLLISVIGWLLTLALILYR